MSKKLKWFYRIGTWVAALFIALNIFTWVMRKYTTELKQAIFNQVDYLLTPAFLLIFIILTVKLIKTKKLFEEIGTKK